MFYTTVLASVMCRLSPRTRSGSPNPGEMWHLLAFGAVTVKGHRSRAARRALTDAATCSLQLSASLSCHPPRPLPTFPASPGRTQERRRGQITEGEAHES